MWIELKKDIKYPGRIKATDFKHLDLSVVVEFVVPNAVLEGDIADLAAGRELGVALRKFDVSGSKLAGDVSVFSAATKMESFNVSGCTGIKGELPGVLIKIISECKVAKFDGCEGPFTLPPTLGATADSIVKVDLSSLGKALRGDVSVFSEATKIESFNVSGCTGMEGTTGTIFT